MAFLKVVRINDVLNTTFSNITVSFTPYPTGFSPPRPVFARQLVLISDLPTNCANGFRICKKHEFQELFNFLELPALLEFPVFRQRGACGISGVLQEGRGRA